MFKAKQCIKEITTYVEVKFMTTPQKTRQW